MRARAPKGRERACVLHPHHSNRLFYLHISAIAHTHTHTHIHTHTLLAWWFYFVHEVVGWLWLWVGCGLVVGGCWVVFGCWMVWVDVEVGGDGVGRVGGGWGGDGRVVWGGGRKESRWRLEVGSRYFFRQRVCSILFIRGMGCCECKEEDDCDDHCQGQKHAECLHPPWVFHALCRPPVVSKRIVRRTILAPIHFCTRHVPNKTIKIIMNQSSTIKIQSKK